MLVPYKITHLRKIMKQIKIEGKSNFSWDSKVIPAESMQMKCKAKVCIDSDTATILFLPKVVENLDDLNFAESI